jgi:hypothetical protein
VMPPSLHPCNKLLAGALADRPRCCGRLQHCCNDAVACCDLLLRLERLLHSENDEDDIWLLEPASPQANTARFARALRLKLSRVFTGGVADLISELAYIPVYDLRSGSTSVVACLEVMVAAVADSIFLANVITTASDLLSSYAVRIATILIHTLCTRFFGPTEISAAGSTCCLRCSGCFAAYTLLITLH